MSPSRQSAASAVKGGEGGWLPATAEGRFIATSLIPVPSQPEGSLVHPRELLDPTAQGHGFVQCSVSLPGHVTTQCIPMTISGAGLSNSVYRCNA